LAQTYTFSSFGNLTNSTGSLVNPFRYTGREFDSETNLYFYRARYYDSNTSRFLSEDPIRFSSNQLNFYAYVSNNPVTLVDSFGTCPLPQYDSVTNWHLKCEKLPTQKDKCACHCVYATDPSCMDDCEGCYKKEIKAYDVCKCSCKIIKKYDPSFTKPCETLCKVIP